MTSWTLEIITMAPSVPSERMMRAASRVHRKVPVRLTEITFSHSSSGMSTRWKGFSTPALLTSRSSPPKASRASAKPRWTSASTAMSISTGTARPPAVSMAATIARAWSTLPRWLMATAAPWAASSNAVPWPMPLLAPVTSARRPSSRRASGGWRRKSWSGTLTPYPTKLPGDALLQGRRGGLRQPRPALRGRRRRRRPAGALPGHRHGLPVPHAPARLAGDGQGARGGGAAGRVRDHRAAPRGRPGHGRRHRPPLLAGQGQRHRRAGARADQRARAGGQDPQARPAGQARASALRVSARGRRALRSHRVAGRPGPFPSRYRGGSPAPMKLLVLATDPVGADDVRSALPDADLEGSEVLVVSPAVNESPVAFWVSDSDEAIAEAESAAEQTAAALREGGARARGKTGESEPLVALQDALATYEADRVLVFVREEDGARYREEDVLGEARRRSGGPVPETARGPAGAGAPGRRGGGASSAGAGPCPRP